MTKKKIFAGALVCASVLVTSGAAMASNQKTAANSSVKSSKLAKSYKLAHVSFKDGVITIAPNDNPSSNAGTYLPNNIVPAGVQPSEVKQIVITGDVYTQPDASNVFKGLMNLTEIQGSKFINVTKNTTNTDRMFGGDKSLKELDLSNFDMSNVTSEHDMFLEDSKLQQITLGNDTKFGPSSKLQSTWFYGEKPVNLTDGSPHPGTWYSYKKYSIPTPTCYGTIDYIDGSGNVVGTQRVNSDTKLGTEIKLNVPKGYHLSNGAKDTIKWDGDTQVTVAKDSQHVKPKTPAPKKAHKLSKLGNAQVSKHQAMKRVKAAEKYAAKHHTRKAARRLSAAKRSLRRAQDAKNRISGYAKIKTYKAKLRRTHNKHLRKVYKARLNAAKKQYSKSCAYLAKSWVKALVKSML